MYYFVSVDIPFITPITDPVRLIVPLYQGVLDYIEISYPLGCQRLARTLIRYHSVAILPYNEDSYIAYDDHVLRVTLSLPIDTSPYELEISAWNLDDTYAHQLTYGINMLGVPVELNLATLSAPQAPPD